MKSVLFIAIFFVIFCTGVAEAQQQPLSSSDISKGIIYYKDYSFGLKLSTNGAGAFANISHRINLYKTKFWQFEINDVGNPKELIQQSQYSGSYGFEAPKSFVYGKQNNFYTINASIGMKRLIAEKADKSGVELSLKYMGGVSLGIVKPYYLDLIYTTDNTTIAYVQPESYAQAGPLFLNEDYIYGASGFTYGLNGISILPGLHFKAGLNFDWAAYDDNIKALEVGITCDVYYKKVPIMVDNAFNQMIIPALYISVEIGKKR